MVRWANSTRAAEPASGETSIRTLPSLRPGIDSRGAAIWEPSEESDSAALHDELTLLNVELDEFAEDRAERRISRA